MLLLERLGQFNFNSCKAVAEEGCNEFYPRDKISCSAARPCNIRAECKEGRVEEKGCGWCCGSKSINSEEKGPPRKVEKNKEVEEDTISSFYNREYKDGATHLKLMAEERGAVAQSVHAMSISER